MKGITLFLFTVLVCAHSFAAEEITGPISFHNLAGTEFTVSLPSGDQFVIQIQPEKPGLIGPMVAKLTRVFLGGQEETLENFRPVRIMPENLLVFDYGRRLPLDFSRTLLHFGISPLKRFLVFDFYFFVENGLTNRVRIDNGWSHGGGWNADAEYTIQRAPLVSGVTFDKMADSDLEAKKTSERKGGLRKVRQMTTEQRARDIAKHFRIRGK